MGRPKQLLPYAGTTLVGNAINQALEAELNPVIVVVGAEADAVQAAIASKPVTVVRNASWLRGMGSSISIGTKYVLESASEAAAVALLAADQPFVTAAHLSAMRHVLYQTGVRALAAEYGGSIGVPAFFRRDLWTPLTQIPPETGAKALLVSSASQTFPLPAAAFDIDTPEDWDRLTSQL